MKPLKIFAAIVFCVMSLASHAQYDFTELTQKLEDNKKELGKSFAALVFKDGKLIYDKKIGEEFIPERIPK